MKYQLDDGLIANFRATVESIQELKGVDDRVLATARVIYNARHGYSQQQAEVDILDRSILRSVDGFSSWCFDEPIDFDGDENTVEHISKDRPRFRGARRINRNVADKAGRSLY